MDPIGQIEKADIENKHFFQIQWAKSQNISSDDSKHNFQLLLLGIPSLKNADFTNCSIRII